MNNSLKNIEISKLKNGITVVSEIIPYVESFSLGFWFNAGSMNETPANNGISHFIEHMLFKGTKKRTAGQISEDIESLGGYLNAFTSKEHTCYYGRGLKQHIEETFEVLADMVQNSVFDPKEIEKEAGVVIDELYDIEDSPEELIFDKFETNIFAGTPLHYPIIGTEDNISGFTQDDLFDYVNAHYVFDNLFIVASGAVDHNELVKYTERYFTKDLGMKKKKESEMKILTPKDMHFYKNIQQMHVILGRPCVGYNDKARTEINLLAGILGEGSSSRLFQSLRENNGITYQVNSFLNSFYDISTVGIYFSTGEKWFDKAIKLANEELENMRNNKVSERELLKTKEYTKGQILLGLESTSNRMMRIAQSMIYFDRVIPVEETIADIEKVTVERIAELAGELFDPKGFTKIVISSQGKD